MAESTPLSFHRRSHKGRGTDSSHLGAAETLSLRRSNPLPQKLLARFTEGAGADAVSPYMFRFSGAGFAYYAPGPETSVWDDGSTVSPGDVWGRPALVLQDEGVETLQKLCCSVLTSCAFPGLHLNGQRFSMELPSYFLWFHAFCAASVLIVLKFPLKRSLKTFWDFVRWCCCFAEQFWTFFKPHFYYLIFGLLHFCVILASV